MVQFTIIIPTYNREKQITSLLASIDKLCKDSPSFEVIVVDDGSMQPVKAENNKYNYRLTVLRQDKNCGPAQARNEGARLASGEFLVFIDDDCLPDTRWLIHYQKLTIKYPESLLGGCTINGLKNNPYSEATQMLIDYLLENYSPQCHLGGFFPTNNMLVPRTMFLELGGFNPSLYFGEDREFCCRWALEKSTFVEAKTARVSHFHYLNFLSFLKLHFMYGSGTFHFRRLTLKNLKNHISYSMPNFYLRLISSPFEHYQNLKAVKYTLLLLCSQLANVSGFFAAWFSNSVFPLNPLGKNENGIKKIH